MMLFRQGHQAAAHQLFGGLGEGRFHRLACRDWPHRQPIQRTGRDTDRRGIPRPVPRFVWQLPARALCRRVGEFSQLLTDAARKDTSRGTNLQFVVTCWYPSSPRNGLLPVPYVGEVLANNLTYYLPRPRVGALAAHASAMAPLATNLSSYPLVLYSANVGTHRRENLMFVEELASQGFVVVGLDHRDTSAAIHPDGTLVLGRWSASPEAGSLEHLADARLVLDQLEQWVVRDLRHHRRLSRPRPRPVRPGLVLQTSSQGRRRRRVGPPLDGLPRCLPCAPAPVITTLWPMRRIAVVEQTSVRSTAAG